MDTFLLRLRFRLLLLLLLLLLPPVAPDDDCPECNGTENSETDCMCKIDGKLKMNIHPTATGDKWEDQDGTAITGATARCTLEAEKKHLTLDPVKAADANKVYKATYNSNSKTQKFKVIPLVVCDTNNQQCTVPQGQNVRLKAADPNHNWYLNNAKKGTTSNFDILGVTTANSGKYEAKDANSVVKNSIDLVVVPPTPKPVAAKPKLVPADSNDSTPRGESGRQLKVKASSDGPAKVGAEWSLECVVTQNNTRVTHFAWLKDDKEMVGQTGAKVVFAALKAMDAAKYRCKAGDDESLNYDLTVVGSGAVAPSSSLLLTLSLLLGLLCC
ncbi:limbic system-associated membrane protein-like [Syngnathus typhle]|uniref:limbic system-associated membrane protein-like n=1 Tax=Syngnathus typhle TaxID=161592 RepID=UPI002A6B4B68|nr:limbic system-associated membrane protein-like [Syngnathus typhle]